MFFPGLNCIFFFIVLMIMLNRIFFFLFSIVCITTRVLKQNAATFSLFSTLFVFFFCFLFCRENSKKKKMFIGQTINVMKVITCNLLQ